MEIYLRFETTQVDHNTGRMQGVFTLAYHLLRQGQMPISQEDRLRETVIWFEKYMPVPSRFSRKRHAAHSNTPGISWVKTSAQEATQRFWELKSVLNDVGYHIVVRKTVRPGRLVYEDKLQAVTIPFSAEYAAAIVASHA